MELTKAAIAVVLAMVAISVTAFPDEEYRKSLQFTPEGPNTRGTDFMVAFIPNTPVAIFSQPRYQLLISTAEPEPVTFTVSLSDNLPEEMRVGFPLTATISYGEVYTVQLPDDIALRIGVQNAAIERSKTIRVRTQQDKKITVQGFNDNVRTSDGFVAISCDAMRQQVFNRYEYFIMAADQFPSPADPPKSSLFLVIPCDDDTMIQVYPTQRITVGQLADLSPDIFQADPGSSITLTANSGQSMMIGHRDDLTGTIVKGNKPLVVISGHQCGEIPYNTTACDHMVEQIPPGMAYGQTFFLTPLGGRVSGDMFRVGTLTDGTQLTVTCVTSSNDTPTRLSLERNGLINRGGYVTFMTPGNYDNQPDYRPSYCCLDSTQPVIVAQYSTGYSNDRTLRRKSEFSTYEAGDPFMSLIPPVHQFMNNHTVTSVKGAPGPFPYRYINLAIATEFFRNTEIDQNKIKINDSTVVPYDGYIPFYCSNNRICGYGAEVEVSKGTLNIYHEQPEVGLFVSYYAYQQQNSNAFPLGFELEPLAATGAVLPENLCVREDAGTLVIPIERYGDLTLQSKVNVATQPSSPVEAIEEVDYTPFVSSYVFRGGNVQQVLKFVYIPIIDDTIEESRESFKVVFTPTKNLFLRTETINVFICDNDGEQVDSCICDEVPVEVWFEPASYTVNEDAGTVTLTIRTNIAGGPPDGAVQFNTADGTATAETDFSSTSHQVAFADGSYTTTVDVPIVNDTIGEGEEVFHGTLTTNASVLITQEIADVHIIDNDVRVWFEPSSYTVNEDAGTVTLNIRTNIAGGPPDGAVLFNTSDGTATALDDYSSKFYEVMFEANSFTTTVDVQITDDSVGELDEVFYGMLRKRGSSFVQITQDTANIHIIDDDVQVWFEPTSYTVDEDAGTVTLIVKTNVPGGPPAGAVEFYTVDHTALSPGDFTAVLDLPIAFKDGSFTTSVTVIVNEDNIYESDEVFLGKLRSTGVGVVDIEIDEATVTIVNNDVVEIGFSPSVYTVNEDGGFVVLTVVSRNPDLERDVVVRVETVPGSAEDGLDFRGRVQTITFVSGVESERMLVLIIDDEEYEGAEEFYARLTTTERGVVIFQPNATVALLDDDVKVYFEKERYIVSESDGRVEVCVRREGDTSGSLTIQVSTQELVPPQAQAGSDYVDTQQSLTFEAGQDRVCFRVTILNDRLSEQVENFHTTITSVPSGVDIGSPDTAIISIMDDETLMISFEVTDYTVPEDVGSVRACLVTNIGNDEPLTITVSTSHLTTSDGDYASDSQNVVIPASSTPSRVCFNIAITNDIIVENDEDFRVSFEILSSATNAVTGANAFTKVLILDNDIAEIGFSPSVYTVNEDGAFIVLTIVNRNIQLERTVTAQVTTIPGTAEDGSDFFGSNQTLTFVSGAAIRDLLVLIINDDEFEGVEKFKAMLTTTDTAVRIFESEADVTIIDDDVRVFFDKETYTVLEMDENIEVCIIREGDISESLSIRVSTEEIVPAEAQAGSDYARIDQQLLSFQANMDRVCFNVTIHDDQLSERVERFLTTITSVPHGVDIGSPNTSVISIIDNDELIVDFEVSEYTVTEDVRNVTVCVRTNTGHDELRTLITSTKHITTSDGDYVRTTELLLIPASSEASTTCFDIGITDDNIVENIEEFVVSFEIPPGSNTATGVITSTRVIIVDNDNAEIGFNPTTYSVDESAGVVIFEIENMTPEMERDVVVQFFTANGTAEDGKDFIGLVPNEFLTFIPGETRKFVLVAIINDKLLEGNEEFYGRLISTDSVVHITAPDANAVIIDNDEVRVYFESSVYEVDEDGGTVTVCVVREGEISQTLTIQVSTSELTPFQAKSGDDFSPISGAPLSFRPDQYRACFPISIVNDDEFEGIAENFTAVIQTIPLGVVIGDTGSTIISILDDDKLETVTAELCGDVCERLDRVDLLLETLCDKLDIQASQLREVLSLLSSSSEN